MYYILKNNKLHTVTDLYDLNQADFYICSNSGKSKLPNNWQYDIKFGMLIDRDQYVREYDFSYSWDNKFKSILKFTKEYLNWEDYDVKKREEQYKNLENKLKELKEKLSKYEKIVLHYKEIIDKVKEINNKGGRNSRRVIKRIVENTKYEF